MCFVSQVRFGGIQCVVLASIRFEYKGPIVVFTSTYAGFNTIVSYGSGTLIKLIEKSTEITPQKRKLPTRSK